MIDFKYILPYIASLCSLMLAFYALATNRKLFIHRVFAAAMAMLALESFLTGQAVHAVVSEDAFFWLSLRNTVTAIIPGIWFVFSLCFSSVDYQKQLSKWKWLVIGLFVLPLTTVVVFGKNFYPGPLSLIPLDIWTVKLEWPGYFFQLIIIIGVIMILFNMERILRFSTGRFRWKLKFLVIGLGCIFTARIYTLSQALLFNSIKMELELVNDVAVICGGLIMIISFHRMRNLDIRFYMSDTVIYSSLTIFFIGAYFLTIGVVAKLSFWFGDGQHLAIRAFFILLAFAGLAILLLSGQMKKRMKLFVTRHLKRPLYDYRQEWHKFAKNTTSVMDIEKLCDIVVRMVSNTFNILTVTIWTLDEQEKNVKMLASTAFVPGQNQQPDLHEKRLAEFIQIIKNSDYAYDMDYFKDELPEELSQFDQAFFDELMIRYCIPLHAGDQFLGIMVLYKKVGGLEFTIEDFDLLKTMADQLASGMLNIMLAGQLRKAKQMEAFQRMSAFFVHDLKNLASNLSLTMQNLPKHFADPEFRKDAFRSLSESVDKIGSMCDKLTSLSRKTELSLKSTDLNQLISGILSGFNRAFGEKISKNLNPVPKIFLDPDQFQKVITNLVINAHEATSQEGTVFVGTHQENGWVVFTVEDTGKGMTRDFIEKSLFQPFETTKKKGIGIGLYHTKTIVEAHHGKIEVESRVGKGTKFKVLLPMSGKSPGNQCKQSCP